MRSIGPNRSLRHHEQELLFVAAKCLSYNDEKVQALGRELLAQRVKLKESRNTLELAEDDEVLANAMVQAKDRYRDRSLIQLGSLMDAIHPGERSMVFRMAPSAIANLGYDAETVEIDKLLVKLRQYDKTDPVRLAYEEKLVDQNEEFTKAREKQSEAALNLAEERAMVLRVKMANDRFREVQFGKLLGVVDKATAEFLFQLRSRPTSKGSNEETPETPTPDAQTTQG